MKNKFMKGALAVSLISLGLSALASCNSSVPGLTVEIEGLDDELYVGITYKVTATVETDKNIDFKWSTDAGNAISFTIDGNSATFRVNQAGEYKLQVSAYDAAQESSLLGKATFTLNAIKAANMSYELFVDTAEAKTTFKQGDGFTADGLKVTRLASVGEVKSLVADELSKDQYNVNIPEGTVLTKIGEQTVTVSDASDDEVATTYKVNVDRDAKYTFISALNKFASYGYDTYTYDEETDNLLYSGAHTDEYEIKESSTGYTLTTTDEVGVHKFELDLADEPDEEGEYYVDGVRETGYVYDCHFAVDSMDDYYHTLGQKTLADVLAVDGLTNTFTYTEQTDPTTGETLELFTIGDRYRKNFESFFGLELNDNYKSVFYFIYDEEFDVLSIEYYAKAKSGSSELISVDSLYISSVGENTEYLHNALNEAIDAETVVTDHENHDEILAEALDLIQNGTYSYDSNLLSHYNGHGRYTMGENYFDYDIAWGDIASILGKDLNEEWGFVDIPEGKATEEEELTAGTYRYDVVNGEVTLGTRNDDANHRDFLVSMNNWLGFGDISYNDGSVTGAHEFWRLYQAAKNKDGTYTLEYRFPCEYAADAGLDDDSSKTITPSGAFSMNTQVSMGQTSAMFELDLTIDANYKLTGIEVYNYGYTVEDGVKELGLLDIYTISDIGTAKVDTLDAFLAGLHDIQPAGGDEGNTQEGDQD